MHSITPGKIFLKLSPPNALFSLVECFSLAWSLALELKACNCCDCYTDLRPALALTCNCHPGDTVIIQILDF